MTQTKNMQWLTLTDYSSKYRISVSTLRRRIKKQQVPFNFIEGKYYLPDEEVVTPYYSPDVALVNNSQNIAARQNTLSEKVFTNQVHTADFTKQAINETPVPRANAKWTQPHLKQASTRVPLKGIKQQPNTQVKSISAPQVARNTISTPKKNIKKISAKVYISKMQEKFFNMIQQKDYEISCLKKEVVDLKTLVNVLDQNKDY